MATIALTTTGLGNTSADAIFSIDAQTHNQLNRGIIAKLALFQTDEGAYTPENTLCKLTLVDGATDDVVLKIEGTLGDDEEDFNMLKGAAAMSGEFEQFELTINKTGFDAAIKTSRATNPLGTLGRNELSMELDYEAVRESNVGKIYDIITGADEPPTGIYMVLSDNAMIFTEALRAAKKLNIPLTVELSPTLTLEQAIATAESIMTHDHHVDVVWNPTLSRPNNANTLKGRLKPRYAMGTLLGRTMLRNANTNANGIPPLHIPIAGYEFPMNWLGLTMRDDVKMTDTNRKKLAKARINAIYQERFGTGMRFVLGDVRTQYDVKAGSPLELTNSRDISMFIDRTVIELARQHLLKPQSQFLQIITNEIAKFMDKCSDPTQQLIVNSSELGGFYNLQVVPRADRPNDAVDIRLAYRPEGATRAVYLNTAVYAT